MPVEKSISRILGKVGADFAGWVKRNFQKLKRFLKALKRSLKMTCLIPLLASVTVLQCYISISDVLNHIK